MLQFIKTMLKQKFFFPTNHSIVNIVFPHVFTINQATNADVHVCQLWSWLGEEVPSPVAVYPPVQTGELDKAEENPPFF